MLRDEGLFRISQIPQKLKIYIAANTVPKFPFQGGKGWKMWNNASVSHAFWRWFLTKTVAEKSTHCRSIYFRPKPR